MTLSKELQALRDFHCNDRCVLTVYLNTNPADPEQMNGAWKIQLKNGLKRVQEYLQASKNDSELKAYKKLRTKVEKEMENNQNDLHKGVVIFASENPELWSVHYVQVPVKTNFYWEKHPEIEQLEYMLKAYPEAGIVLPSFGEIRILDTAMGFIHDERTFEFDSGLEVWREQKGMNSARNRGTVGSPGEDLDQRLKENFERFFKEMGPVVEKMKKDRGWKEVHIAGEAVWANSFSKVLRQKPDSCIHKNLINVEPSKVLNQVFER